MKMGISGSGSAFQYPRPQQRLDIINTTAYQHVHVGQIFVINLAAKLVVRPRNMPGSGPQPRTHA
jgi:hypothetical protein